MYLKYSMQYFQVFASRLECEEKAKAVVMLQRALDEQRDLTLRLTNEQVYLETNYSFHKYICLCSTINITNYEADVY